MISVTLSQLGEIVGGRLLGEDARIDAATTDTRALLPGQLFVALVGARFDGHRFAEQAVSKGAAGLLVSRELPLAVPQVVVDDTRLALGRLGQWVKRQVAPKTVAITGSNGKTTVKEMVAAILARRGPVLATAGNFNNDIGVPLTLLRLEPQHRFAVLELGANHLGEIAYTTRLVEPDVVTITNVAAAHLEGFGDAHGVARAKSEIFHGLTESGSAVLNSGSDHLPLWRERLGERRLVAVSESDPSSGYHASDVSVNELGQPVFILRTPEGEQEIRLPLLGRHNVMNAVIAAALTHQLGCSLEEISSGLAAVRPVPGRLNLLPLGERLTLIDDSYNANIGSVCAAIDLLADTAGRRLLVLGDMGELGDKGRHYHQQAGEHARRRGIDRVFTLGELSRHTCAAAGGLHSASLESLVAAIIDDIQQTEQRVTILVKGSRSAAMERVVHQLQQRAYPEAGEC